jgi:CPA1 family monovalent cation:H+ antiporter
MSVLLLVGLIGLIGFSCQWLAWKTRQPAILYLLIVGMILGPFTGILNPDALFQDLLFPFVSLAVAIILFEGSLTLKRADLRDVAKPVRNMVTFGAVINGGITAITTYYFTALGWQLSCLFGAMMVVTGPTVIVPLLRAVRPSVKLSKILRWEGIIIDPLGALFAVLIFEWIIVQSSGGEMSHVFLVFLQTIAIGAAIGIASGYLFGLMLRKHWIPEYLHNFSSITFVSTAFVISNSMAHESGLLAVTIMGIWLANMRDVHVKSILAFKESLTLIFVSVLFVILAARINLEDIQALGVGAIVVLVVMQFIARPTKIFLSTLGTDLTVKERLLLSWIGPRGIVAAAVSALFALRLEQLGFEQAHLLVPLSFTIIIGTVFLQSLTAKAVTKALGVSAPTARGHLIIGANPVAIKIAIALKDNGAEVVLCDSYRENIKAARMAGLDTYYGNPISHDAESRLDLASYSIMLGLSQRHDWNIACALRFREDFSYRHIFSLASNEEPGDNHKHITREVHKGRTLFSKDATYGKLASIISRGGKIRQTTLSETFGYEAWHKQYEGVSVIKLFCVDTKGSVHWFTVSKPVEPKVGWTICSLIEADDK